MCLELVREMKNLWNMWVKVFTRTEKAKMQRTMKVKVTVLPIVNSAFETISKVLLKWLEKLEISRRAENIKARTLLRSPRMLRRVLETWRDFLPHEL